MRYIADGYIAYRYNSRQYYCDRGACDNSLFPAHFIAGDFEGGARTLVRAQRREFVAYICVYRISGRDHYSKD